jgi:hypothetical protein
MVLLRALEPKKGAAKQRYRFVGSVQVVMLSSRKMFLPQAGRLLQNSTLQQLYA